MHICYYQSQPPYPFVPLRNVQTNLKFPLNRVTVISDSHTRLPCICIGACEPVTMQLFQWTPQDISQLLKTNLVRAMKFINYRFFNRRSWQSYLAPHPAHSNRKNSRVEELLTVSPAPVFKSIKSWCPFCVNGLNMTILLMTSVWWCKPNKGDLVIVMAVVWGGRSPDTSSVADEWQSY